MEHIEKPIPVYLDQNVFSRMQKGEAARESLLNILNAMTREGTVFVYSMVHVSECRDSENPEALVEAMESVSAHFLEKTKITDAEITLSSGRANELILSEPDIADEAQKRIDDLLKPLHFASGWLGEVDAKTLQEELVEGVEAFWGAVEQELPQDAIALLAEGKAQTLRMIDEWDLQQMKGDGQEWQERFRKRLPKNYAQLDEMPEGEVAYFLLSCLDDEAQREVRTTYPRKFWANIEDREEGKLTGLAFMLFIMGVARDSRVWKKDRKRRERHFRGQFRDCQHIEEAAKCAAFVTLDKGAERLAKAVYAYAGVNTQVFHLTIEKI